MRVYPGPLLPFRGSCPRMASVPEILKMKKKKNMRKKSLELTRGDEGIESNRLECPLPDTRSLVDGFYCSMQRQCVRESRLKGSVSTVGTETRTSNE